jgi:hypothetical protein
VRHFLRTEADCLVTLPNNDADPQRFVEYLSVLDLDETNPAEARIADNLAAYTHGWVEVDEEGTPLPEPAPPAPLWEPPPEALEDPLASAASVDSPLT